MEMFTVVVCLKNSNTTMPMAYKTMEAAERVYNSLRSRSGAIEISDDFGVRCDFDLSQISVVSVTDVQKNLDGQLESKLLIEVTSAQLQDRLTSHPMLRKSTVFRGNPQMTWGQ